jgi:universal stress protein A
MIDIKNIIVPTDFSKLSQSAFEQAKNLAEMTHATLHLLYIIDKNLPFISNKNFGYSENNIFEELKSEAKKSFKFTPTV